MAIQRRGVRCGYSDPLQHCTKSAELQTFGPRPCLCLTVCEPETGTAGRRSGCFRDAVVLRRCFWCRPMLSIQEDNMWQTWELPLLKQAFASRVFTSLHGCYPHNLALACRINTRCPGSAAEHQRSDGAIRGKVGGWLVLPRLEQDRTKNLARCNTRLVPYFFRLARLRSGSLGVQSQAQPPPFDEGRPAKSVRVQSGSF